MRPNTPRGSVATPVRPGSSAFRLPLSQETRLSPTPGAPIPIVLGSLLHLCSTAYVPHQPPGSVWLCR